MLFNQFPAPSSNVQRGRRERETRRVLAYFALGGRPRRFISVGGFVDGATFSFIQAGGRPRRLMPFVWASRSRDIIDSST